MKKLFVFVIVLFFLDSPNFANAQKSSETYPRVPNVNVPANELGNSEKDIVFHKDGITAMEAEADIRYCYNFIEMGPQREAPSFVFWGEPSDVAASTSTSASSPYGLVGNVIGLIVDGPIARSLRQMRLYACMVPKGYSRYRTSREVWDILNEGNTEAGIKMQAEIAAGPRPETPNIEPSR